MKRYDIAVVGGGASGLTAAISAKRENSSLSVCVLERLPRVGKKLLVTGNGRCNLTNRNIDCSYFKGTCSKLYNMIKAFDVEAFFGTLGVICTADGEGRVYPKSNTASSVLDALRLETERLGIDIICDFCVKEIKSGYIICSDKEKISAQSVILAGGGLSQPTLGSDGSVLRLCKDMGIKVGKLTPALTAVKTNPDLVRALKGLRVQAKAKLFIDNKEIKSETGEIQFNEGILSGICIFNLTNYINDNEKAEIRLDLLPDMDKCDVIRLLSDIKAIRDNAALEDYLSGIFHKRIGNMIIKQATPHQLTMPVSALSNTDIERISGIIKELVFPVKGLQGFEKSQVTSGGVLISEIDEQLMSNKYKGMYFCGEMLDIIGICGGYNLTFAFSSGYTAGKNAARRIISRNDKN